MSLPTASDFNKFTNTKLTGTEWNQNVDKTINVLTNGNYDLNINDITADQATITTATVTNLTATNANFNTIQNVSGNATAGNNSHIMANATNGALTLTLPQASDNLNKTYVITKSDSTDNPVKIDPNSSELINGASEFYLNVPYESITIICDGTQWFISNSTFDTNKVGKVVWSGSNSLSNDVLELNGQYIDPTQYPRINALYGTTWGSSGSNIQLPDLRSYFPKGKETSESIGASLADMTSVSGVTMGGAGSHIHSLKSIHFEVTSQVTSGSYDLRVHDMKRPLNDTSSYARTNHDAVNSSGSHTHTLTGDSRTQPASAVGHWVVYF